MTDESTSLLTSFRSLSFSQKFSIPSQTKPKDAPYIVELTVQNGVNSPKVATACTDNAIHLFVRESLITEGSLSGHSDSITDVKFGKTDSNLLISSSTDQTVRCWDLRSKGSKEVQKLKAPIKGKHEILTVDCNNSDHLVCAGTETDEGDDTHLLFWDRRAGSLLGSYTESHDDSITKVCFQPGSDTLLASAGSDGLVCVFDVNGTNEDEALQMTFNIESCVVRLGWLGENHKNVYSVTSDHRFYAWDALEGDDQCFLSRESALSEGVREYIVDCIATTTAVSQQQSDAFIVTGNYSGALSLLRYPGTDEETSTICTLTGGHTDTVRCLHWDPQTKTMLTGGEDSSLCLWSSGDDAMPKAMSKMKIGRSQGSNKNKKKPYQKEISR